MPPKFYNKSTSRAGQKWTDEEDAELMTQCEGGMSFTEVAQQHGRSEYSIKCRLWGNIKSLVEKNRGNVTDLCDKYHTTVEDYESFKTNQTTTNFQKPTFGQIGQKSVTEKRDSAQLKMIVQPNIKETTNHFPSVAPPISSSSSSMIDILLIQTQLLTEIRDLLKHAINGKVDISEIQALGNLNDLDQSQMEEEVIFNECMLP